MANVKNLSLSHIKKEDAKKFKDKKQVLFHDGNVKVDVDLVFRPSKRNEVSADLMKLMQGKLELNPEEVTAETSLAVILCLIIRHFSTLDVKGAETFDDYLEMFKIMTDNGYLSPILQSFDPQELQSTIEEVSKNLNKWTLELNKEIDDIKAKQDQKEVETDGDFQESQGS